MLSTLSLVYPPMSNQEAEWVKSDPHVEERIRKSDLYLIGARNEATFHPTISNEKDVRFTITTGDNLSDEVILIASELAHDALGYVPDFISVDFGPKLVQFFDGKLADVDQSPDVEPFAWFTTEKLIHDRGRDVAGVRGFNRFREFAKYDLLYVGIAKSTDTFSRLFDGAHQARQRALSNERPRRTGARVTDELFLFPLKVVPLVLRELDVGDSLSSKSYQDWVAHSKTIVVDAEKALVSLLGPDYNVEQFRSFPKSTDGLYGYGYERYGFVLAENMTFATVDQSFVGSRTALGLSDEYADLVVVSDSGVELRKGQPRSSV